MMTNLLAAVTVFLTTNTTEVVTGYDYCEPAPCPDKMLGCLVNHTQGVNPNAKTTTTKVEEVTLLKFQWNGEERVVPSIKLLSSTNVYWTRGWTTTNTPVEPQWLGMTNVGDITIFRNNIWIDGSDTNYVRGTNWFWWPDNTGGKP